MHTLPRKKALDLIRAAGVEGNHRSFMRLYVENRISYPVALAEYRKGVQIAKSYTARDIAIFEIAHERGLHSDDDADVIAEIYAERALINASGSSKHKITCGCGFESVFIHAPLSAVCARCNSAIAA